MVTSLASRNCGPLGVQMTSAPPRARLRPGGEPGEHDDRELQALGGVDRHDAHGVVVGLGQDRFGDADAVGGLAVGPREVLPQRAAAGLAPHAGLVDQVPQPPPHVPRPGGRGRHLEDAAIADEAVEQLARRRPVPVGGEALQVGHGVADRVVVTVGAVAARRAATLHRPPRPFTHRYSSGSLQPNSGERSVLTRASSSLGSSTARRARSRERTSRLA